jgi:glycosyltransferase involved in cell wall biosynthesis
VNPKLDLGEADSRPIYSVVIPFYNEAGGIGELYSRLTAVMNSLGAPYEMIFVNDGSQDATEVLLEDLAEKDGRVTVLELRRNFGQTPALAAGFDHARGEVIISMDGDLQHAPEDIPALLEPLEKGYDLVSGWRKQRVDNFLMRRLPSRIANSLMRWLSGVKIHDFGTTFKVYRRDLLRNIRLYGELHRFIPALASAVGARICEVPIQNIVRPKGRSSYGIGRTVRVLMDLLTVKFLIHYFTKPLHFMGLPGLVSLGLGSLIEISIFFEKVLKGWGKFHLVLERGPLLVTGVLLIVLGILFLITGLLGELVVRTYYESQSKQIYYIRNVYHRGTRPHDDT